MKKHTLSKTGYISYLACPEEYWMSLHQRELMPPFSVDAQHKVEQGKLIDKLAQDWFRSGLVLDGETIDPELIDFQKTAKWGDFIAIADVVVTIDDRVVDIYEVKASNKKPKKPHKKDHINDVAFQRMVFEGAGYEVKKCHLVCLNRNYIRGDKLDIGQLFESHDITEEVDKVFEKTKLKAKEAIDFINLPLNKSELVLCPNKGNCLFLQNYFGPVPEYSVFDITGLRVAKLQNLVDQGIWSVQDVPADFKLTAKMREQVDIAQENKIIIRQSAIRNILDELTYPYYFLDYETFAYAVPQQKGIKPHQQMAFQYSLHILEEPRGELKHFEYLLRSKTQPVEGLINAMKSQITSTKGTVFVWNKSFEMKVNAEMAVTYPQHTDFLLNVNEQVFDLRDIFTKGLYHHPRFKGKTSLKSVLPVLCPDLSYKNLEIQNGGAAIIQWHHATDGRFSVEEQQNIFKNLLAYCHLDTLAMVRIWEVLNKHIK